VHGLLLAVTCLLSAAETAPPSKSPSEEDEREVRRYLQAAAALYRSLDNERALEQLAEARALPHRLDDSVQISLLEGLVFSDLGNHSESEAAFRAAFALDPGAKLPFAVSPKLEASIERLRAETIKQLRRSPPIDVRAEAPPAPSVAFPAEPPPAPLLITPPSPDVHASRPAPGPSPWIPTAVGGALLAGAGVCAFLEQGVEMRLRSGDPTITTTSQLDGVVREGKAYTTAGVVLAATGAAALGVAGFMVWRNASVRERVSLIPVPSGAAAVWSGSLPTRW
jgi:tetratricopeptide (TPR) repeat protein